MSTCLISPVNGPALAFNDFLSPAFAESDSSLGLSAAGFPAQFKSLTLAYKVAAVLKRLRIGSKQVGWVFEYAQGAGWLDLNRLPLAAVAAASPLWDAWMRLIDLTLLRDGLRQGEKTLTELFKLSRDGTTPNATLVQTLSDRTDWRKEDINTLLGGTDSTSRCRGIPRREGSDAPA